MGEINSRRQALALTAYCRCWNEDNSGEARLIPLQRATTGVILLLSSFLQRKYLDRSIREHHVEFD